MVKCRSHFVTFIFHFYKWTFTSIGQIFDHSQYLFFFFSRLESSVLKSWFLTEILVSSVQWNNSEKNPELLNVTLPGVQCIYDIWAVLWFISECDTLWANMTHQSSLNVNWKLFADIVCATRYSCKKKSMY